MQAGTGFLTASFLLPEVSAGSRARGDGSSKCTEKVTRFALIKTEKTASSTLFSILARFILQNQLNVMVMTKGGHLDVSKPRGAKPGMSQRV